MFSPPPAGRPPSRPLRFWREPCPPPARRADGGWAGRRSTPGTRAPARSAPSGPPRRGCSCSRRCTCSFAPVGRRRPAASPSQGQLLSVQGGVDQLVPPVTELQGEEGAVGVL